MGVARHFVVPVIFRLSYCHLWWRSLYRRSMTNCRSCGQPTERVLTLGEMPLANHLLEYPSESYKKYPLELMFCPACKLGQLHDQVDPSLMFDEYVYYSSINGPTVNAAKALVSSIVSNILQGNTKVPDLIAEIGSNDGYLLDQYRQQGFRTLGIDPARGPANEAARRNIPTVQDYFTLKLAKTLPKADVIHAHNVLAHVRDLNDFVSGIAEMLKPDGVVVVEVPDFEELLKNYYFDTLYSEHNYYFTQSSLETLFLRHQMKITRCERIPAHGGSLRVFLTHSINQ
jgi:SAM-dependent methyltransferase